MMLNLEDSGYQGYGSPKRNLMEYLVEGPVTVEDFIMSNANKLLEGREGLLNMAMKVLNPIAIQAQDPSLGEGYDFDAKPSISMPEVEVEDNLPYDGENLDNWPEEYTEDVDNFWKQFLRPIGSGTGSRGNVRY
tara:strand:- start:886 stop:1287 length:402 start_codon:yes stop_codon:yes gene_type:complete